MAPVAAGWPGGEPDHHIPETFQEIGEPTEEVAVTPEDPTETVVSVSHPGQGWTDVPKAFGAIVGDVTDEVPALEHDVADEAKAAVAEGETVVDEVIHDVADGVKVEEGIIADAVHKVEEHVHNVEQKIVTEIKSIGS